MPNTTNFNWATPADTDLVKDGAAAIRTLGDSIDTSLVDLKGGTTGQVLTKASNADLDFTFSSVDPLVILDAKGDLISATAADTPARLAVGNDGETLVANSAASVGLSYSATPSASNPVLNSAFQVWQRGTSISLAASTTPAVYTTDRWQTYTGANQATTISRQATGDTTNLPNIQYCVRFQRDSGQTGTGAYYFNQNFETINSISYAGKTVTLSFYARKGANYSEATSIVNATLYSGTGTDQSVLVGGFTGAASPISQNATLTTTWQRFTYTGAVAATATQLAIFFNWAPTGTAGAADYLEVTGVQIDVGSVALPFRTNGGTLQGELAACQRYYYRAVTPENAYGAFGTGLGRSATTVYGLIPLPVPMRITPTSIEFSTVRVDDGSASTGSATAITINSNFTSRNLGALDMTFSSGTTQFRGYVIEANNSTAAYVAFSAEL